MFQLWSLMGELCELFSFLLPPIKWTLLYIFSLFITSYVLPLSLSIASHSPPIFQPVQLSPH